MEEVKTMSAIEWLRWLPRSQCLICQVMVGLGNIGGCGQHKIETTEEVK